MLKKVILLVIIFIIVIVPVYAAEFDPNVTVDYTTNEITVYGDARINGELVTCYIESPDKRIVWIGSSEIIDNQYSFSFVIDNPVEGTYYGRLKIDNDLEVQSFNFVYALKSGLRSCGVEYEQSIPQIMPDTSPELKTVHVELVSIIQGLYRLTINKDNTNECVYDDSAEPFFFWRASEGTFVDFNDDYTSVIFKVDPNTSGKEVRIVVGMGDGLGQVDYRVFSVSGMNSEY